MQTATASSRPRFRTDLVAEPIDEDGQRFIDVIDPDTGNAFRFYEIEYSIACAMDGERDVGGLAAWAREELGITPSSDELTTVISTLGDLGYLDAAAAAAAGPGMFGEDLVQKGVVVPAHAQGSRGPDIELGSPGGLTAGWTVPATAAHEAQRGPAGDDVELGRAGGRAPDRGGPFEPADVSLGAAGASARDLDDERPAVLEFEAPTPPPYDINEQPSPSLRRSTSTEDDEGPTHLPQPHAGDFDDDEVSVDLSEHLAIRPDDVKEAVRASQVMKAVDVPPELLAQLDEREAQIAGAAEAAKQSAREAQAATVRNTPVMMPAQPEPGAAVARPPVELPREPVAVGKPKLTKQAEAAKAADAAARAADAAAKVPVGDKQPSGTSPLLIVLLVLVILGAGAFLVWKYVLDNKDGAKSGDTTSQKTTDQGTGATAGTAASGTGATSGTAAGTGATAGTAASGTGATTGTASGTGATTGSAAVGSAGSAAVGSGAGTGTAAPTGTLHAGAAGSVDLKAPQAGVVAIAPVAGAKVAAGDVVVRLLASPHTEAKLAEIDYDLTKRYPAEIKRNTELAAQARTQGNEALAKQLDAKIAERQKRIEDRSTERAKYADELSKLELKTTAAGTVKKAAAKGAQVAANDVVATIDQGGGLSATLDVPGATYKTGDTVKVASKKAPDQQVDCTVASVDGSKVAIACAADSGWADGTEIVLAKP